MVKTTKIAFIGTHGVGKTTLVLELTSDLRKLDINAINVPEVLGKCPIPRAPTHKGAEFDRERVIKAQEWILHSQAAEELRWGDQYTHLVCDRSAVDNYAYMVCLNGGNPFYDSMVKGMMKTYDFLFKVPINEKYLTVESAKNLDRGYQKKVDTIIIDLMEKFNIPYHNLPLENPIQFAKEIMGLKK